MILRFGKCRRTSSAVRTDASMSSIASTKTSARVGAGGLQQLQPRRVAVVHLVAEAAHEVDLRDARLQRGERDAAHAQHAADDLAEAAEARDRSRGCPGFRCGRTRAAPAFASRGSITFVCSDMSSGLTIIEIVTTMTSISASAGSITR